MKIIVQRAPERVARQGYVRAIALAMSVGAVIATWGGAAVAKTPGETYCFNQICHRVLTLKTLAALIGREVVHETSYYDGCRQDIFNPCGLTSSGEVFRPGRADNAASPVYPDGTTLLVYNPETGKAAVVRVNNAGPYWGRRKLDVSRATAEKLGFRKRGIAKLHVMVIGIPTDSEARYRQRRRYDRVPGPIGQYRSLDDARRSISGFLLTASARFTGMRTRDLVNAAVESTPTDEMPGEETREQVLAASQAQSTDVALAAPGTLSRLVRPLQTAAVLPSGPAPTGAPGAAARGTDTHGGTIELAALHLPADAPSLLRQPLLAAPSTLGEDTPSGTPEQPGAAEAAGPGAFEPPSTVPVHAGAVPLPATSVKRTEPDASDRAASDTSAVLTARSVADNRPVEMVATRRLDILSADQQAQPVLSAMTLDTIAAVMDRDLKAGRVTLFSAGIPIRTLHPRPPGRLGLFARAAAETPTIGLKRRVAVAGFEGRVSDAVRWTRSQVSLITNVIIRDPAR